MGRWVYECACVRAKKVSLAANKKTRESIIPSLPVKNG